MTDKKLPQQFVCTKLPLLSKLYIKSILIAMSEGAVAKTQLFKSCPSDLPSGLVFGDSSISA